jgi:hypothetical protein
MAISGGPDIVEDGLVLHIDAADKNSYPGTGSTWYDLSGNGNNGTIRSGQSFNSGNAGNFYFNGLNNQYVVIPHDSNLNVGNNITVNIWFYLIDTSIFRCLISKLPYDYSLGWELDINAGGRFRVTFRPSATQINFLGPILYVNNWYMGTMTFDNSGVKLYVNGLYGGGTSSGGPVTLNSNASLRIGGREQNPNYIGNISYVSIYDKPLEDYQILQNYNATKGRYGL